MKKLLMTFLVLFISASIGLCGTTTSYDKYGNKTGSYRTNSSGTTTSYDRYGNKTGSYKTDSSAWTVQYDKYGNRVGTYK